MEKYSIRKNLEKSATVGSKNSLLDKVLADAKPIVPTSEDTYDLKLRPTELSSGGYIDYAGDAD